MHPTLQHTNWAQQRAPPELCKNPQTRSIFICVTLLKWASKAWKIPLKFPFSIFMSQKAAWNDPDDFCGCVWWAGMVLISSPLLCRWTHCGLIILCFIISSIILKCSCSLCFPCWSFNCQYIGRKKKKNPSLSNAPPPTNDFQLSFQLSY